MSFITINELTKQFNVVYAVKDFSLKIEKGEFISFLGPSGCGKTTTLRMIAGFIEPTEGKIQIGDELIYGQGVNLQPEERNLGMVFQSYAVWPHMTVFENIAYPLKIKKVNKKKIKDKVSQVVEMVNLQDHVKKYPNQLSGGQQQRVALARALVMEPSLLLLDEPLSNLDAKLRDKMRAEIKNLQTRTGVTIIYVTHDQVEALSMSDRIVVMNQGVIQQIGSPEEMYNSPTNEFVADFIGRTNFLKGRRDGSSILLEGTSVVIPLPASENSGKRDVTLCYRPESIKLVKRHNNDANHIQGQIVERTYLGNVIEYVVQVDDVQLKVETADKLNLPLQTNVAIELPEPVIF
ncbi:ABC transporter ATP-binding protein [Oceanobacillus saliphilus]|uniref:ABC transporter ATP-binding protein n=1 Tax=Oceanobacillus saliphilus TaxID=2925834 RepID=UPI00201DE34B|nr:ABC transporter ATP-binding protein [Oceanobacillus saliphilus]